MLSVRGTPAFYAWSRKLYELAEGQEFPDGRSTVRDLEAAPLRHPDLSVDEWSGPLRMSLPAYMRTIQG